MKTIKNINDQGKPASKFMKRPAVILTSLLLLLLAGGVYAENKSWVIRLRSAPIRSEPSIEKGSREATLYAGQSCEILIRNKDWVQVQYRTPKSSDNKTGWIHATALQSTASKSKAPGVWVKKGAKGLPDLKPTEKLKQFIAARHLKLKPILEMEKEYPSAKTVEEFLASGKLGLWREDWPSLEAEVKP